MFERSRRIYVGCSLYFKGNHIPLANTGKTGNLVTGDFEGFVFGLTVRDPTILQLQNIKTLAVALKKLFPTIITLGGHRDYKRPDGKKTACPGKRMYSRLNELRLVLVLNAPPHLSTNRLCETRSYAVHSGFLLADDRLW